MPYPISPSPPTPARPTGVRAQKVSRGKVKPRLPGRGLAILYSFECKTGNTGVLEGGAREAFADVPITAVCGALAPWLDEPGEFLAINRGG
jgi:hypothetical protein